MVDKINHKELAISRLATQFKESTNLISYIKALLLEADNLEQVFCDLLEKRWIDTAEGVQLDIIGAIVGQTREFVDAEIFDYFGFADNPQAQSFGSLGNPSTGGRFIFEGEPTTGLRLLTDEEYRLFIRARILRNSTSSTPEEIISQIRFLFNSPLVIYSEIDNFDFDAFENLFGFLGYPDAKSLGTLSDLESGGVFVGLNSYSLVPSYRISIGRRLGINEKSIVRDTDIIPKTAGVQVEYVTEFDSNRFFGFLGIPNSDGFGTLSNPELGGEFGNLIF